MLHLNLGLSLDPFRADGKGGGNNSVKNLILIL